VDETPETTGRNPFSSRGFVLSAAFVVALIAAAILLAVLPRPTGPRAEPIPLPTPKPTSSASQAGTEPSVCGLPASDDTALGAAPDSSWELVGTMAVPTSPKIHGPGDVDDTGFRSCFAHSPTGALYAAANIWGTGFYGDAERLYRDLAADSPTRDAALSAIDEGKEISNSAAPKIQIRGFIIKHYEEGSAVIDLGIETADGALGTLPTPLVWEGGDWKLNLPQTGQTGIKQLATLNGYISWSGV